MLRQVGEEADRTVTLPAVPRDPDGDSAVRTTKPPVNDPTRRTKLVVATSMLMIMTLGVLVWIGAAVAGVFAADTGASGGSTAVVSVPSTAPPNPTAVTGPPNPAARPDGPLPPDAVEAFSVRGDADGAGKVAQAVDGTWQAPGDRCLLPAVPALNPASAWSSSPSPSR